jgi:excisionase family DNA binding protein
MKGIPDPMNAINKDPEFLSVQDLADYLDVSVDTVYRWNAEGTAPKRYKIGKAVYYRRSDIVIWLETRVVNDVKDGE